MGIKTHTLYGFPIWLEYTPLYTGLNYGTKIDLSPTFTLLEYTLSLSKKPLY